jgi:hypothetical protein
MSEVYTPPKLVAGLHVKRQPMGLFIDALNRVIVVKYLEWVEKDGEKFNLTRKSYSLTGALYDGWESSPVGAAIYQSVNEVLTREEVV